MTLRKRKAKEAAMEMSFNENSFGSGKKGGKSKKNKAKEEENIFFNNKQPAQQMPEDEDMSRCLSKISLQKLNMPFNMLHVQSDMSKLMSSGTSNEY